MTATANIQPIDKNKHAKFKVKSNDLKNTAKMHICPALAHELPQLAAEFPVLFVKDDNTGSFHSVAMLGLKPGENLFLQNNKWQATYIPGALRTYPFSLVKADDKGEKLAVCIDEASSLICSSGKEGSALYNDDGTESEFLTYIADYLTRVIAQGKFSDAFSAHLDKLGLFEEQTITVKLEDGSDHRLTGVFRVDETKLNTLGNEDFLKLRELGYLPGIYAHLSSLRQVNNLSRLNTLRNKTKAAKAKAAKVKAKAKAH